MKNEQKLKFKDLKAQIIEDLNACKSQKQFINTLDFYFRCNNNWKGYKIKKVCHITTNIMKDRQLNKLKGEN